MDKLLEVLGTMGIPFAYDHFAEGESPAPPFLCYLLPGSHHFAADGRVYFKIDEIRLELYTEHKDLDMEKRVEDALDSRGIYYEKSETWIGSEKLYEVLYSFEQEGIGNV